MDDLICPETGWMSDGEFDVKNEYSNQFNRESFHVEMIQCKSQMDEQKCKSDSLTKKFFETFYFTSYILSEQIDFLSDNI